MPWLRKLVGAALVLGGVGAVAGWFLSAPVRVDAATLAQLGPGDAAKGERIFYAGGCTSCHARPKSEGAARLELAGGLELKTPFGIFVPPHLGDLDRPLLTHIYSAKNNCPWGQGQKRLVEVAHRVANSKKSHVKWFMHAVRKFGRLESMTAEGTPGLWQKRYDELRAEHKADPAPFEPARELQTLVEFLFPALVPLP